jgi:hypothetical protein
MTYTRTLELISQVVARQRKDPDFTIELDYQASRNVTRLVRNVRIEPAHDHLRNSLLQVTEVDTGRIAFLGLNAIKAFYMDYLVYPVGSDDPETFDPAIDEQDVHKRITALVKRTQTVDVYVDFDYTAYPDVQSIEGWLIGRGINSDGMLFITVYIEDVGECQFNVDYITNFSTSEDVDAPADFQIDIAEKISSNEAPKVTSIAEITSIWGNPSAGKIFEAMGKAADLAFRGEKAVFIDDIVSSAPSSDWAESVRALLNVDNGETETEVSVLETLTNVEGDVTASFSYTTARGSRKQIENLTPAFVRPSERHPGQSILVGFLKQENNRYVRKTFRTDRITDLVLSTS